MGTTVSAAPPKQTVGRTGTASNPSNREPRPQEARQRQSAAPVGGVDSVQLSREASAPPEQTTGDFQALVQQLAAPPLQRDSATAGSGDAGRTDAVREALESGDPVRFTNSEGDTESLRARRILSPAGTNRYSLTVGDDTLRVTLSRGLPVNSTLARIADYYSQQPDHLRSAVH
ncbi:MAG: hypothetical protein AB1758_17535, partial [Candidatus Eremiobacterota bacterium]